MADTSVNIAVDTPVEWWSSIGRLSVEWRSSIGWLVVESATSRQIQYVAGTWPLLAYSLSVDTRLGFANGSPITRPTVKHHLADILTNFRRCQLSTDTPPISYWYSTDDSPLHYRHTSNPISTDCRSICRLILDRQENADILTYSLPTLGRLSTDIAADMSIDGRLRYLPTPPKSYIIQNFNNETTRLPSFSLPVCKWGENLIFGAFTVVCSDLAGTCDYKTKIPR